MTAMTQTTAVDPEAEIASRLAQLSLEQKVGLMTGADIWALHPIPEIGLRRLVTSDGPAGVRGETWDERSPSANVPSPTSLAASWDPVAVERVGRLLASEARRKGVDVLLAPTVNLHRTPYGGRHFECFSEDPELTAVIGTAYVAGLQAEGVAATVKHFVANDSETDRFSVNALVEERVLRELYLTPFERIVAAGAWAVMAAYNKVNGTTMTENPSQREVLKDEWGFDGVIVSDWYATRSPQRARICWIWRCPDPRVRGPNGCSRRSGPARCPKQQSTGMCCASCGSPPGSGRSMGSTRPRRLLGTGARTSCGLSCVRPRRPEWCCSRTTAHFHCSGAH